MRRDGGVGVARRDSNLSEDFGCGVFLGVNFRGVLKNAEGEPSKRWEKSSSAVASNGGMFSLSIVVVVMLIWKGLLSVVSMLSIADCEVFGIGRHESSRDLLSPSFRGVGNRIRLVGLGVRSSSSSIGLS